MATIPVLHVSDIDAAVGFYTEKLGFSPAFSYGTYRGIKLGSCELHLTLADDLPPRIGGGKVYVICDEVDDYWATIKAAGGRPAGEPVDRAYGFRDFAVLDPDGNQITFGQDIEEAHADASAPDDPA